MSKSDIEIKNEALYDIDNKSGFIEYIVESSYLKCGNCKCTRINPNALACPKCGSYDLVPWTTEKKSVAKYVR